ncbi:MAG TPA: acetate--CoA ligase family protein [Geobacteraceae bacterium]|nr:acetate--CoA ligase family protein [Geobacteraceae bacterium]
MDARTHLAAFLAARDGRGPLLEHEIKAFLGELGVAVPQGVYLPVNAPLPVPFPLSWPLVAKLAAPGISSKSDVGGIRFGIDSPSALDQARAELMQIKGAEGVLLEETAPPGVEMIVGGTVDPQFGPVVMFGLGGVFVELFRDVAFALAPLTGDEALLLIERTRGAALLRGFRGKPPLDRRALSKIMVAVGELIGSGLLEEIDLNPVVLYPRGALVLDAKMKKAPPNYP